MTKTTLLSGLLNVLNYFYTFQFEPYCDIIYCYILFLNNNIQTYFDRKGFKRETVIKTD